MSIVANWFGSASSRESVNARRRLRSKPTIQVESLEGRALLSRISLHPPRGQNVEIRHQGEDQQGNHGNEPNEHSGLVSKAPSFYEFYTGPKRPGLNVVAASARIVGSNLILTGRMQGQIDTNPKSADLSSFFVFGINRGGAGQVAPFFNRPGVVFNTVVIASVQPSGISGRVSRFDTGTSTDLPSSSVQVHGRFVKVTVPLSELPVPANGASPDHWTFNLWPRNSLSNAPQPNHGSTVASFIPENAMAPIAVVGHHH